MAGTLLVCAASAFAHDRPEMCAFDLIAMALNLACAMRPQDSDLDPEHAE